MKFFLILHSVVILLFPLASAVLAADVLPAQAPQSAKPDPYANIPDEYIREAQSFYGQCASSSSMYMYYNCKCLATKFLDQRISLGPSIRRNTIQMNINTECLDATQTAGYEYQNCLNNATLVLKRRDPEEYCECYANTYVRLFETMKMAPSSKTFEALQTQAYVTCDNPERAKALYSAPTPNK